MNEPTTTNAKNVEPSETWDEQLAKMKEEGFEEVSLGPMHGRPFIVDPESKGEQITVGPKYTLIARTYRIYYGIRGAADAVRELITQKVSDIIPRRISWLWPDRIARGKVSMIAGDPGLGKSQITLSIAATVSTGGTWPDCASRAERGRVLILTAEDDSADTLRPRLEVAGADLTRVEVIDAVRAPHKGGSFDDLFDLTQDLPPLQKKLTELGDVAMVIIDPITAYLGETDSHRNADVRAALAPLVKIASHHNVAIILISHLNKIQSSNALERVTGSGAFVATARAVYLVSKDREDTTDRRRLFLPVKNNVGQDRHGLAYHIEEVWIPSADGPIKTSRIKWEPGAVETTANEALAEDPNRSAVDDAVDWLAEFLAQGPVAANDVESAAKGADIKGATLRRAKKKLGIKAVKSGMEGGWVWRLPEDDQR